MGNKHAYALTGNAGQTCANTLPARAPLGPYPGLYTGEGEPEMTDAVQKLPGLALV